MRFLKRIWPQPAQAETTARMAPTGHEVAHASSTYRPNKRQHSRGAIRGAFRAIGAFILVGAAGISALLFVTWNTDYWLLRDRIEHIRNALFGGYVSPECRRDPTHCVGGTKSRRPIVPPKHVCDRRPELAISCQMHTLYDEMNMLFFGKRLPGAVITLQRKRTAAGFFAFRRFRLGEKGRLVDEIALNPQYFKNVNMRRLVSTLAHEMCHQEIAHFDTPPKDGFHSMVWARCMLRIGLRPTAIGNPSKMTGKRVTHRIVEGGRYDRYARRHPLIGDKKVDLTQLW